MTANGYGVIPTDGRHPGTVGLARWLTANEALPDGTPRAMARLAQALAAQAVTQLPDGPELSTGLRKLLEAKDCFVRAAIEGQAP